MRGAAALVLLLASLAATAAADAPSADRLSRIDMLERTSSTVNAPDLRQLPQGLRDLGYVEGTTLVLV